MRLLGLLAACLAGHLPVLVAQSDDLPPSLEGRFAAEPKRPKAETPVRFSESWEQARAEAKSSGRRILAYFTGDSCGWCRALEVRTLADAEVVALSRRFVCVKLKTSKEENLRLCDEYGIDQIPRSLVLTSDGRDIDRSTGYVPAAEYAAWLAGALTKPPASLETDARRALVPRPVGAPESEADLVVWFVDAFRSKRRWGDADWTEHAQLIGLLRAAQLHPRIEHLALEDFPARWEQAEAVGKIPDLISAEKLGGVFGDLYRKKRLVTITSSRLSWTPGNASCPDFAKRFLHLVTASRHEEAGRKAASAILEPGPQTDLPGPRLPVSSDQGGAEETARRAVVSYATGDARGLKDVSSDASPQLARCTKAPSWRRGLDVQTGPVQIRGGAGFALARVEVTYRDKQTLGADPFLVVLCRESSRWRAFAIIDDVTSWNEVPDVPRLLHPRDGSAAPATPRLTWPPDQAVLRNSERSLTWELPDDGEPVVAQVCMLMSDDAPAETQDPSWPRTMLTMRPGATRGGSFPTAEYVTGVPVRWCVWSIGTGGRMSVSEVRGYEFADFRK